jgi:hypothetical protein
MESGHIGKSRNLSVPPHVRYICVEVHSWGGGVWCEWCARVLACLRVMLYMCLYEWSSRSACGHLHPVERAEVLFRVRFVLCKGLGERTGGGRGGLILNLFRIRFVLSFVLPPLPDFPIQLQERANHIRERVQATSLGLRLCVCGVFFMCMFVVCFGCTCVCVVCVCVYVGQSGRVPATFK